MHRADPAAGTAFEELVGQSDGAARRTSSEFSAAAEQPQDEHGEAEIELAAGHDGRADAARHLRRLRARRRASTS